MIFFTVTIQFKFLTTIIYFFFIKVKILNIIYSLPNFPFKTNLGGHKGCIKTNGLNYINAIKSKPCLQLVNYQL